jgi:hypothetical protein
MTIDETVKEIKDSEGMDEDSALIMLYGFCAAEKRLDPKFKAALKKSMDEIIQTDVRNKYLYSIA